MSGGTARQSIDGQAWNGAANVTVVAPATNAAASKTTPVDGDSLPLVDSAASNALKKLTWANLKTAIRNYYNDVPTTISAKLLTYCKFDILLTPNAKVVVEFPEITDATRWFIVKAASNSSSPEIAVAGPSGDVDLRLNTQENGVVRINGVQAATRLTNTATLDFGSVNAQSFADLTITVTGAATGDAVALGTPTAAITAGIAFTAWVSATNTVTVRAHNYTAGALDPASGTFRATIIR